MLAALTLLIGAGAPALGVGPAASIPALIAKASPFSKAVLALLVGLSMLGVKLPQE